MASINILFADFFCDCGAYWEWFPQLNNEVECSSCGKKFIIHIDNCIENVEVSK